jgi:hypothetical protein
VGQVGKTYQAYRTYPTHLTDRANRSGARLNFLDAALARRARHSTFC